LLHALGQDVTHDALLVSLKTSAIAHAAVLVFGTPAAWVLARKRFVGRGLVLSLVELPLVLPPAVAGIALLATFGRAGLLGDELSALGIQIPFTQTAVVLAVAFVESPFYLRGAIAAFEAVDTSLLDAARTLGASPARVFARVGLPLPAGARPNRLCGGRLVRLGARGRRAAGGSLRRLRLPGVRALPAPDGRAERHVRRRPRRPAALATADRAPREDEARGAIGR